MPENFGVQGDLDVDGDVALDGTTTIGDDGIAIDTVKLVELTVAPGTVTANTTETTEVTVTGVTASDKVWVTPPSDLENGLVCNGAEAGADKVTVAISNTTAADVVAASKTWQALVVTEGA